jgi:hypothetical protein
MKAMKIPMQYLMKTLVFGLLAALGLCRSAQADIVSNLAAYWKMDEATGFVASDATANLHDAYLSNFVDDSQWLVAGGQTNGACQFTAANQQYAVVANSESGLDFASMTHPAITVSAWVRGDSGVTQMNGANLVTKGYGRGGEAFCLDFPATGNKYRWMVRDSVGVSYTIVGAACNGTWQHVVAVFDSTAAANGVRLYVNGVLSAQANGPASLLSNTHTVSIGGREGYAPTAPQYAGYDMFFSGALDDVRIYNRALSQSDIWELYYASGVPLISPSITTPPQSASRYVGEPATFTVVAAGTAPLSYQWQKDGASILNATNATFTLQNVQLSDTADYTVVVTNWGGSVTSSPAAHLSVSNPAADTSTGLLAYLKMDEATGGIASDATGNGHNALLNNYAGDSSQWVAGRTNNAFDFNAGLVAAPWQYGTIDDTGNGLNFALAPNPALTLSAWVRGVPGMTQTNGAALICKGRGFGWEQYNLDIYGNNFRFSVRDSSAAYTLTTTNACNGRWQHVVAVFDSTEGPEAVKLYLNGQLMASRSGPTTLTNTWNVDDGSSPPVVLGCREESPALGYTRPFLGKMDDVRIYNRAFTPADVQALYASAGGAAPVIYTQPQNTTALQFYSASLSVFADGTAPLSYQWRQSGTNVPNATNVTLSFPIVQAANAGPYTVVITNLYGSITSAVATLTVQASGPGDYTNALIAWWQFEEGSGTVIHDSSATIPNAGYGTNTCTLYNGPTDDSQWVRGRVGQKALRFNVLGGDAYGDKNDYLLTDAPLNFPYNQNQFTFAFWAKSDSATDQGGNPRLLQQAYFGSGTPPSSTDWLIWRRSGGQSPAFGPFDPKRSAPAGSQAIGLAWTHYAIAWDTSAGSYTLYTNGVFCTNAPSGYTRPNPNNVQWVIAHLSKLSQDTEYFRGQLDDFRIYNRILTASQVAALYASFPAFTGIDAQPQGATVSERGPVTLSVVAETTAGSLTYQWQKNGVNIDGATSSSLSFSYVTQADAGTYRVIVTGPQGPLTSDTAVLVVNPLAAGDFTTNLVARYTFDETNGDIAHDSSGNGYDATLYNWATGAPKWEPGVLGNALHFNGSGPVGSMSNYVLTPVLNYPVNNTDFTFAFWAKSDSTNNGAIPGNPRIFATQSGTHWVMWALNTAPYGVCIWHGASANPMPETNVWHHYVVSFNRGNNLYDVYVDGVRKVFAGVSSASKADPTSLRWVIGHVETLTSYNTDSFRGLLDDVRIYNRLLTINDAEALYQDANIPPVLSLSASGSTLTFSWPSWASSYVLKSATSLASGATWSPVPGSPTLTNATLTQTDTLGSGLKFYRLVK